MDEDKINVKQEPIASLGNKFASRRKELGLTQSDIASKIRVRKTIISQLEDDQPIKAPAVFLKGYIKSYAEVVGLPEEDYKPYLDSLSSHPVSNEIKNYSLDGVKRKKNKRLFILSLLVILVIVGFGFFFLLKDDKSHLVEVNHYITPSTTSSVNS